MSEFIQALGLSECENSAFENYNIIKSAINNAASGDYCGIKLPSGKFPIYNKKAIEIRNKIVSGENCECDYDFPDIDKNTVFEFDNLTDFKIMGNNTTFLFEGYISPFCFENCRNIRIKGITVNWNNSFKINKTSVFNFKKCKNTTLEDITVHSSPANGIFAEETDNINLYRLYIKPSKGNATSITNNAAIFKKCKGIINFNTCCFDGISNDAVNAENSESLNLENCILKNIGGRGIVLDSNSNSVVKSCLFGKCKKESIYINSQNNCGEYNTAVTENRIIDCLETSIAIFGSNDGVKIIGNKILGQNSPVQISSSNGVLLKGNLIGCKREVEVLNSENIIIKDNKLIDYDDIFKISPAVFAVGKEYHIMQPMDKEYIYGIKIGDKIYYDEINGIMRSDCDVHRVIVPMDVLDKNKEYTVIVRRINDRVHNTPLCDNETIEKTYGFKPISENGSRAYYIADSHNLVKAVIDACKNFGDIDFLILNGDLQCHSAITEDFLLTYDIASELTNGEIPIVFGRGNHETLGRKAEHINDYIPNQNGKTYFTFRLGNIWGLMLDCGCDHRDDMSEYSGTMNCSALRERQIDFINDVISNADNEYNADGVEIRLIISHIPFTDHMTGKPQENIETYGIWQKLIEENIEPDLMITGHMHEYSWHNDNCKFPLIVSSVRMNDLFGGMGFVFSKESISAISTDSGGNIGKPIVLNRKK